MATRINETPGERPRIIVDCTHTFHTGAYTGIQRVVRHFADGLLAIGPANGVEVVPVRIAGRALVALPVASGRVAFPRASQARESAAGTAAEQRVARWRGAGHRLNVIRSRQFARWLDAGPNAPGLSRWLGAGESTAAGGVSLRKGDILLSLDSSWVYPIRDALDEAGRRGARRLAMLCDVLPVSHPEWFTEGTRLWFEGWLRALLPRLDGVLTISDATAVELRSLAAAGGLGTLKVPPAATVHLGADLPDAREDAVRPLLRRAFESGAPPAFLTVGTIEPRKNYGHALDIFEALLARDVDVQWHFAGATGWLSDATVRRIREHPQLGARLHWWPDLSDGELAWLYGRARALVAVSRAEGYGLPIAEARGRGLAVFASDIPVFREVLAGEGRFLPLEGAPLAAAALEDFLDGALAMPPADGESRAARSWEARSRELLAAVLALARGEGITPPRA
jgi:glycosyltransferase involved in cell wall biosynthesis